MWKRLRDLWALIADTAQIAGLDWKAVGPYLFGAGTGAGAWVIGLLTGVTAFWIAVGVPVAALAGIVVSAWVRRNHKSPGPNTAVAPVPAVESPPVILPKSIEQLFKEDFPECGKVFDEVTITSNKLSAPVRVPARLCLNFKDGIKFVAFYVKGAPIEELHTFHVCAALADACNFILEQHKNSGLRMEVTHPGDISATTSRDLVFSGRVYIYYEDNLSIEKLGELTAFLKNKGLSPQFKGPSYATNLWLQEKARLSSH